MKRQISKERQAEIKAKKEKLKVLYENKNIQEIFKEQETSEREYAKKFKRMYITIRKALVLLKKQRELKIITSEEAVNCVYSIFKKFAYEIEQDANKIEQE